MSKDSKKRRDARRRMEREAANKRTTKPAVGSPLDAAIVDGSNPRLLNKRCLVKNRRFNRFDGNAERHYIGARGGVRGKVVHEGYLKCRLVHGDRNGGLSLVVPEMIFLGTDAHEWIQPLGFLPNLILRDDVATNCGIFVDVSCEQTVGVRISNSGFVRHLPDGSELYRAAIDGPADLAAYTTGKSELRDGRPWLKLFHHTTEDAKRSILSEGSFRLSQWNIQGNKKLVNVGYLYLTPLPDIRFEGDLKQIAMASDEEILLRRDLGRIPDVLPHNWRILYAGDYLSLKVYRGSTRDRTGSIVTWVDASHLSPQHLLAHNNNQWWSYEVVNPFIHRVGATPGRTLPIVSGSLLPQEADLKRFEYVVVGDATSLPGLAAPYDEEETKSIFKIEACAPENILDFWMSHSNQDLFSTKTVEYRSLARP